MNPLMIAASETRRRLGLARNPFLGEVLASDFITGNALAEAISLSGGVAQHSDSPWLKFNLDGKSLLVAKRSYRHSISWDHINAVDAVYGTRQITVKGRTYKIRLLKGAANNPTVVDAYRNDPVQTHGSEWNRLFYPLVPNPINKSKIPTFPYSSEGILFGEFGNYTDTDLLMSPNTTPGTYNWTQETDAQTPSKRVIRGTNGVDCMATNLSYADHAPAFGWRPVLELVE